LNGLGDRQDVARTDRSVEVPVALERVAFQRGLRRGLEVAIGRFSSERADGICSSLSCTQLPAGMFFSA